MVTELDCGRCGETLPEWEEVCWFCQARLCGECWERYGHCGHPEADEANRRAREVGSEQSYNELKEKGQMAPTGRVIATTCDPKLRN